MAITISTTTVTPTSYVETIKERTCTIRVDVSAIEDSVPVIQITRELAYYKDGILETTEPSRIIVITLEDLAVVGKSGLMQEISETIDAIAQTK